MNQSIRTAVSTVIFIAVILLRPTSVTSQTNLILAEPQSMKCVGDAPPKHYIRLQGQVLARDGTGIEGAFVSVKRSTGQGTDTTKPNGNYCIDLKEGELLTKVEYSFGSLTSLIRNLSGKRSHNINKVLLPSETLSQYEKYEMRLNLEENLALDTLDKSGGRLESRWFVISKGIVKDNFGRRIANTYYGVQITLSNGSYDTMQVVSTGFTIPSLADNLRYQVLSRSATDLGDVQSVSYDLVRRTLERGAEQSPRNLTLRSLASLGSVLTGLTPFFHVPTHRSNFLQIANIISNPIEAGIQIIFPDNTMAELKQLENTTLREGAVIAPGTNLTAVVFLPKDLLNFNKKDETPQAVMKALGELVVVSDRLRRLDREMTVSNVPRQISRN
jgi:hypothetical protein